MGYMMAGGALAVLGLEMILGAAYLLRRAKRLEDTGLTLDVMLAGVDVLLKRQRTDHERLERMEKLLTERGPAEGIGQTEAAPSAERESELSRAMEEGMTNLLQYAAGKVPGVEVSV